MLGETSEHDRETESKGNTMAGVLSLDQSYEKRTELMFELEEDEVWTNRRYRIEKVMLNAIFSMQF